MATAGLTPAEILARRKNYATSVIKAQNPTKPQLKIKEAEEVAATAGAKKEDGDDQRTKLRKWMEEKKRRDTEERQKNRDKQQQQQQQPQNRSSKFAKKNDRLITRNGVTTVGTAVSLGTTVSKSASSDSTMPRKITSKPKLTKSETSVFPKKVTFNKDSRATNSSSVTRKNLQQTPLRPSLPKSNVGSSVPSFATPSRLSSKKFETLSPDSKFGHWLQLKGKTVHQVKHVGCVTPSAKSHSTQKKKKSSVSFAPNSMRSDAQRIPQNADSIGNNNSNNNNGVDEFADLLTRLETGKCSGDNGRVEVATLCGGGGDEGSRSLARYWLCQAHLLLDGGGDVGSAEERKRKVFAVLERAVDNAAKPKTVLAEGIAKVVLKLMDFVEAQRLKASVPSDGTFTLESDVEQEENDTYTKEQNESLQSALTPPASPPSPTAGLDPPHLSTTPINIINASLHFNDASTTASSTAAPPPPPTTAVASTPIIIGNPSSFGSSPAAVTSNAPLPPPPLSLSLDVSPTTTTTATTSSKVITLGEPLSPPLSDDDDDEGRGEEEEEEEEDRRGMEELSASPRLKNAEVIATVTTASHGTGLPQSVARASPGPGLPQSVAAELVTTSPHFVGVRHSKPVAESRDVSVEPLDGSATEAEERNESRKDAAHNNTSAAHNNTSAAHNNTSATSGCSSLHDVTNFSTWANFDSDESLEVVELSFDGGVTSRGDDGNDVTDGGNDVTDGGNDVTDDGRDDNGNDDVDGLGSQSFSELYLTGESSAECSAADILSATIDDGDDAVACGKSDNNNNNNNNEAVAEVEAATEEADDDDDAEEEESEEEANKENTPPNNAFDFPDVCDDMDFVLMASPVLDKSRKSHQRFSHHVGQPFASSTVKLWVKDETLKMDGIGLEEEEGEEEEEKEEEEEEKGVDDDDDDSAEEDRENQPPQPGALDLTTPPGALTTPPYSRKSMLKSTTKVVVTPVRRSLRATPRVKATEEKRRLMDDLDDLTPQARKNSVLIPNKTILNLSFGQATEGEEGDEVVDEDDVK